MVDEDPPPHPDPRPPFETERLVAEPVTRDHAAVMARVMADPIIHRFLDGEPETEAEMRERYRFLEGGRSRDGTQRWWTWILTTRDGETVGFVESTIEEPARFYIGYALHPDHWRKGYGREASAAVVDLVFERFGPDHCLIEMDVENEASVALAESLGFRRTGTTVTGDGVTEYVYRLDREEWRPRGGEAGPSSWNPRPDPE